MDHNYWACALEPRIRNYGSPRAQYSATQEGNARRSLHNWTNSCSATQTQHSQKWINKIDFLIWEEKYFKSNYVSLKTQWLPIIFKVKSKFPYGLRCPEKFGSVPQPQLSALTFSTPHSFTSVSQVYQALLHLKEVHIPSLHVRHNSTITLYCAAVSSPILCAFYDPYFPLFFPRNSPYLIYYIFVCFYSLASPPKWCSPWRSGLFTAISPVQRKIPSTE